VPLNRTPFASGWYVDATLHYYVIVTPGKGCATHHGIVPFPPGEKWGLQFVRISPTGDRFAGHAHDLGGLWEYVFGIGEGKGWRLVSQATSGRIVYSRFGELFDQLPAGYQYVDTSDQPVSRNRTYLYFHGLNEWSKVGPFYIGQGHETGGVLLIHESDMSTRRVIDTGTCFAVNTFTDGTTYVISYLRAGEGAIIVKALEPELLAQPVFVAPKPPSEDPKVTYKRYGDYFKLRWNELGIPQKMAEITQRRGVTVVEKAFLKNLSTMRKEAEAQPSKRKKLRALPKRTLDLEAEYKAVQVPALVLIAGELHHAQGNKDVGLSVKNSGNNFTLPDGSKIAADIITVKPTDSNGNIVAGNFHVVDALTGVGSASTRPQWLDHGVNNDPKRPWVAPPMPGGIIPVPVGTHPYTGGGNDRGKCDVPGCGKPLSDPIHAVPEGKIPHTPWLGEDGKGVCDLCGQDPDTGPLHQKQKPDEPDPDEPDPQEPEPVEYHAFVGTFKRCGECGELPDHQNHQKPAEPTPGTFSDVRIVVALGAILAEQKRTTEAINNMSAAVVKAAGEINLGGLGNILKRSK
jgi:hypothetical protein